MAKRWSGSSKVAQKGARSNLVAHDSKQNPRAPSAQNGEQPAPTPTPDLLSYPAFDLERVHPEANQPLRVGDQAKFAVSALQGASHPLKLRAPEKSDPGWMVQPDELTLALVKPGEMIIPSLLIEDSKGQIVGRTQPMSLRVQSVLGGGGPPSEQKMAEIRPPVGLEFPVKTVAAIGVATALGLILLGYAVYRFVRRKKPAPVMVQAPVPPRPAHEIALEELQKLQESGCLGQGYFKRYYFGMSEILKRYISARYQVDAIESTSSEIEALLPADPAYIRTQAMDLLARLDLVKFTDHRPDESASENLTRDLRSWIKATGAGS